MDQLGQISGDYTLVLAFIIGGVIFVIGGLVAAGFLRPHRPNPEKNSSYECGEDPEGNARIQLNNRFYVAALIFLIFDVEIIFLFPWSTVFADVELIRAAPAWGWFSLVEILLFTGILIIGLAYVWAKGDLDWVKPNAVRPQTSVPIPEQEYEAFNERMEKSLPTPAKELA